MVHPKLIIDVSRIARHCQKVCDEYPDEFRHFIHGALYCDISGVAAAVEKLYHTAIHSQPPQRLSCLERIDSFMANFKALEKGMLCAPNEEDQRNPAAEPKRSWVGELGENQQESNGHFHLRNDDRPVTLDEISILNSKVVERQMHHLCWRNNKTLHCKICEQDICEGISRSVFSHFNMKNHREKLDEITQRAQSNAQMPTPEPAARMPSLERHDVAHMPVPEDPYAPQPPKRRKTSQKQVSTDQPGPSQSVPQRNPGKSLASQIGGKGLMAQRGGKSIVLPQQYDEKIDASQDNLGSSNEEGEIFLNEEEIDGDDNGSDDEDLSQDEEDISQQEEPILPYLETLQRDDKLTSIQFREDPVLKPSKATRYAGLPMSRPKTEVTFYKRCMNQALSQYVRQRLDTWEPYWKIETVLADGITSPVDSAISGVLTAAQISFALNKKNLTGGMYSELKKQLGRPVKDGLVDLLLWMLPWEQPDLRGKADCHLWPTGTFLQFNGAPLHLDQRRFESFGKKWKGLCSPLRLAEHIKSITRNQTIQICCEDEKPYLFVVAFCRYQDEKGIYKSLKDDLTQLPYDEGRQKAKAMAAAIVDDGVSDGLEFRLACPTAMTLMEVPVRAPLCGHFQCFDLWTFVASNKVISGNRWRCPICDRRISFRDLEVCCFTKALIPRASNDENLVRMQKSGAFSIAREMKSNLHMAAEVVELK